MFLNSKIFYKVFIYRNINKFLCFLLITILLSSCKIFRSKNHQTNTHTHETELKNSKKNTPNFSIKSTELVSLARNYMGVPYKSGGTSEAGMDCSGLIFTVCKSAGFSIPRISYQQAEIGEEIGLIDLQIGDFVFFNFAKSTNRISHVGLVTETNFPSKITFIHSSTSKGVREDNLFTDYWKKAFVKATRPFVF